MRFICRDLEVGAYNSDSVLVATVVVTSLPIVDLIRREWQASKDSFILPLILPIDWEGKGYDLDEPLVIGVEEAHVDPEDDGSIQVGDGKGNERITVTVRAVAWGEISPQDL